MPPIKLVPSLTQLSISCLARFFEKHLWQANDIIKSINLSSINSDAIKELPKQKNEKEREELLKNLNTREFEIEGDVNQTENGGNYSPEKQLKILKAFLVRLAQDITSHAHCTLQESCFWTILTVINRLYNKPLYQEVKKLVREIVPLFINSSLRALDFGSFKMFTEAVMFEAIYNRLSIARNLEKLVFGRSCYWRSRTVQKLSQVLLSVSNLKILHIKYICQPEMLRGLPESCPHLRELSLEGSKDITNEDVPLLSEFVNIDTLDISGTAITGRGCRCLVLQLAELKWLTHCPFNCNSDVLIFESRAALFLHIGSQLLKRTRIVNDHQLYIEPVEVVDTDDPKEHMLHKDDNVVPPSSKNNENPHEMLRFKLKYFWLFNPTTEELFLTHLCPNIESLRLDFVMQDLSEVPDMGAIKQLSHLNSLTLNIYDTCPVTLVINILESTQWLTSLHLHLGDDWFFVAPIINTISQFCHNLTYLMMEGDYKGRQHSLEDADERLDFSLPPGGLSKLKEVKLAGCVSDTRLMHLLTQAPNLHVLHMDGELEWLHDDTFTNAIRQDLLLQLEVLWFNVSAGITFSTVRRLLQSENNLQRVGRLCLMSSASKDTYQELLRLVKRLNLATELIWVTDQRELREAPELSA